MWMSLNTKLAEIAILASKDFTTAKQYVTSSTSWASSIPVSRYMAENGSAVMVAAKWTAGVTPGFNVREYATHTSLPMLSTLALKPRGDITRSLKQEYQWSQRKDLCPPKMKQKESYLQWVFKWWSLDQEIINGLIFKSLRLNELS